MGLDHRRRGDIGGGAILTGYGASASTRHGPATVNSSKCGTIRRRAELLFESRRD